MSTLTVSPHTAAHPRVALAIVVTCQLMIGLDFTIVTIALPKIQQDVGFSPTGLSWVMNAYLLAFGGLLLLGGRAGDILGGALTGATSWRWVFFVNIPIGIAVVVLAPRFIAHPATHPGRLDLAGAATVTGGMVSLVYALITAADSGWREALPGFAAALVLLGAFVVVEMRARQPIMPLRLLATRARSAAYLIELLLSAGMFGFFFFMTQFVQWVLRMDPLAAGFAFLPMAVTQFSVVRVVPRLLPRFGARRIVLAGATVSLAGMVWLTQVSADTGYFGGLFGPMILLGLGGGLSFMPLNATVLTGVPPQESGAASGLAQTTIWAGGALGSAALVTVYGSAVQHGPLVHGIAVAFGGGAVFSALALVTAPSPSGRRAWLADP